MRLAVVVIALAACGRIGFDPLGAGDDGSGSSGDAMGGDAGSGYAGESCATAGVLVFGQQLTAQSLAAATYDVTAAPCAVGIDVVYRLTSATSGLRTFTIAADFGGALVTAQDCPPIGVSCSGFMANQMQNSMTSVQVGTTYVIVEKSSGTGTTFSIRVQ